MHPETRAVQGTGCLLDRIRQTRPNDDAEATLKEVLEEVQALRGPKPLPLAATTCVFCGASGILDLFAHTEEKHLRSALLGSTRESASADAIEVPNQTETPQTKPADEETNKHARPPGQSQTGRAFWENENSTSRVRTRTTAVETAQALVPELAELVFEKPDAVAACECIARMLLAGFFSTRSLHWLADNIGLRTATFDARNEGALRSLAAVLAVPARGTVPSGLDAVRATQETLRQGQRGNKRETKRKQKGNTRKTKGKQKKTKGKQKGKQKEKQKEKRKTKRKQKGKQNKTKRKTKPRPPRRQGPAVQDAAWQIAGG